MLLPLLLRSRVHDGSSCRNARGSGPVTQSARPLSRPFAGSRVVAEERRRAAPGLALPGPAGRARPVRASATGDRQGVA